MRSEQCALHRAKSSREQRILRCVAARCPQVCRRRWLALVVDVQRAAAAKVEAATLKAEVARQAAPFSAEALVPCAQVDEGWAAILKALRQQRRDAKAGSSRGCATGEGATRRHAGAGCVAGARSASRVRMHAPREAAARKYFSDMKKVCV